MGARRKKKYESHTQKEKNMKAGKIGKTRKFTSLGKRGSKMKKDKPKVKRTPSQTVRVLSIRRTYTRIQHGRVEIRRVGQKIDLTSSTKSKNKGENIEQN